MVSSCANPGCRRPLHYLREGRVFLFDASPGNDGRGRKRPRPLEHYWLCGNCAQIMTLMRGDEGVHVIYRTAKSLAAGQTPPPGVYS
jgi:hypothetical protein